jgi:CheY-like chemotaxis protein
MARVLIIDDDDDIVDLLRRLLTQEGYQVQSALGHAAVALAADWQPDLILLDLMMEGLDGEAIKRRLRAQGRTADLPIIVMSAAQAVHEIARQMDVQGVIAKPFDINELLDWVQRYTPVYSGGAGAPPAETGNTLGGL